MKYKILFIHLIAITFFSCSTKEYLTTNTDFNFNWEFKLEDSISNRFDTTWKKINLPHDWSIDTPFDSINGEGATGYLLGGTGFYKKKFTLNLNDNQVAYLVFDGVYNNATISLNNQVLGEHPYGYAPFFYEITEQLHPNTNTVHVTVDRTRYADSRWYTGSGIYRNVNLITKNKLHIPVWGTFITTPQVNKDKATVKIETQLKNGYSEDKIAKIYTEIFTDENIMVGSTTTELTINEQTTKKYSATVAITNPILWDVDKPTLYKAITKIIENDKVVDTEETIFGIRSIRFDANTGFYLNGKNRKIKGVCLHHDAGLVGAAVPKSVWRRRLEKLKDAGCNAIRISHNPASNEFLDLCDEMGFLVQDEFFDEWDNPKDKRKNMNEKSVDYLTRGYTKHFQNWAERDLKNTILSHRNHPSIFQWSIGNEIEWTYPRNAEATGFFNNMNWSGNYFWSTPPNNKEQIKKKLDTLPKATYDIGKTAQKLAKWTKELDTTRYVIANCILPSSSYESGYADALDIIGFSYRRVLYDYGHENYPNKPLMGTENLGQWHEWKAVMERPFVSGTFLWTGIDYLGESNGGWPKKGTPSGLLDLAGFEKPSFYMFKSLWSGSPSIYIATQTAEKSKYKVDVNDKVVEKKEGAWQKALWVWQDVNEHWNYDSNQITIVEVYSNSETVELFLNEKSLGTKNLADFEDHIYKWAVPFEAGTLKAVGLKNGKKVESLLKTSTKPKALQISTNTKIVLADGYDTAHIVLQIIDNDGNPVKTENQKVLFTVTGDAKVLGVDNGSITNTQNFNSQELMTDKGRALLIVQSIKGSSKPIRIKASSNTLTSNEIEITIKPNKQE